MHMDPPTASPMPMNFCSDPASRLSITAIIAVNTGICAHQHTAPFMS